MDKHVDILQTLLACDKAVNRKVATRSAVELLMKRPSTKKVMLFGGMNDGMFSRAIFIYDAETDRWSRSELSIPDHYESRRFNSGYMTMLHDGSALIFKWQHRPRNTVGFIFNPYGGGKFEELDASEIETHARFTRQSVVTLHDGRIMRIGGLHGPAARNFANSIFDPATRKWRDIIFPRRIAEYDSFCVVLGNGDVLITGGLFEFIEIGVSRCMIYKVETGALVDTGSMNINRAAHAGCLLENGHVFVHGGFNIHDGQRANIGTCEEYDPDTGTWTMLQAQSLARSEHSCILLSTGKILVAGGGNQWLGYELYDPETDTFTTGELPEQGHSEFFLIPLRK